MSNGVVRYTKTLLTALVITLSLVVSLFAGDSVKSSRDARYVSSERENFSVMHSAYFQDEDFFNRAYSNNGVVDPVGSVKAGVVPHHLLASHTIARFFQGLERNEHPEVVVVIGPDHENRSFFNATVSQNSWLTPYGILKPQTKVISALVASHIVGVDERVFTIEHSISAEVAFIKRSFPNATFVPIVLKSSVSHEEAEAIARGLSNVLPEKSLVLASVDFAHYVSPAEAQRENKVNIGVLTKQNIEEVGGMFVDSKSTIYTLFRYLDFQKVKGCQILETSDTSTVVGDSTMEEVTSYISAYYYAE